ncbi:hydroxyacylglutathione hydrolase [Motiliproteus sediminis]|uniref:hydroxyacylglutathione hydrolase n=1 Tax=Motiliproteus sediminis TaxID=1468178 RepID=UPI001AF028A8|nr:hydroxyacylglutathione hydrolase [Motiliproteus sediminis]
MLQVQPIPAFDDNYIWMAGAAGDTAVLAVDPGDASVVEHWLTQEGKNLAAILITHHHADHTGGVAALTADRDIPVYGPANSPCSLITHPLNDGDQLDLLGASFAVRATPAHTLDHISYYLAGSQPQLFCGDTLFLAGCGRLFEGSAEQMQAAMDYFASLPDNTEVYCTHEYSLANLRFAQAVEPDNSHIQAAIDRCQELRKQHWPTLPSHIGEEKRINPFMRTRDADVVTAAGKRGTGSCQPGSETLAAIRQWKDVF